MTVTLTDTGGPSFTTALSSVVVDPATPATTGPDKPWPVLLFVLLASGLVLVVLAALARRRLRG
jgi:hypothetical protein